MCCTSPGSTIDFVDDRHTAAIWPQRASDDVDLNARVTSQRHCRFANDVGDFEYEPTAPVAKPSVAMIG
jgi:hypothetical protein